MIIRNSKGMAAGKKRRFLLWTLLILVVSLCFSASSIFNTYIKSGDHYGTSFDETRKKNGVPELGQSWVLTKPQTTDFLLNWRPAKLSGKHIYKTLEFGYFGPKKETDVYSSNDPFTTYYSEFDYSTSSFKYFRNQQNVKPLTLTNGKASVAESIIKEELSKEEFERFTMDTVL